MGDGHLGRLKGEHRLDVFGLRERLVDDYEEYTRSFIAVRDARVEATVDADLKDGLLWPEPLVQLNPSYASSAGKMLHNLSYRKCQGTSTGDAFLR